MKKRIMVIGPDDREKAKVIQLIEGKENIPRVSSIVYLDETIQIPSSYLRGSGMMKHIISIQQNADAILMILSAERVFPVYSPNFAKAFRIPSVGIILTQEDRNQMTGIIQCRREFKEAKVEIIQELNLENDFQSQQFLHTINLIKEGMI